MTLARRRPPHGFTLLELMIALAIVCVLTGLAVPSMSRQLATQALQAQVGGFVSTLHFARSEAVARAAPVTACAADPASSTPRCAVASSSVDWRSGWIVFVDHGARGRLEPGDQVLRVQQPWSPTAGVPSTRAAFTFTPGGFALDAAAHLLFTQAGASDDPFGRSRLVCVSKQGRTRVSQEAACD